MIPCIRSVNLDDGCAFNVKEICALVSGNVVKICDVENDANVVTFSKRLFALFDLLVSIQSELILLFESWRDAKTFWTWLVKFDLEDSLKIHVTSFGIDSEKSLKSIFADFEVGACLETNCLIDRCVIMDSYVQKQLEQEENVSYKDFIPGLKSAKGIPKIMDQVWISSCSVCYLGLSFIFIEGQPKLTRISFDSNQVILVANPSRPNLEADGLGQLISYLESKRSEVILFFASSFICLPVLLDAIARHGLLDRLFSVVVGVADLFKLCQSQARCMVESHSRLYILPNLKSFKERLEEDNPILNEILSDANFIENVALSFLTTEKKFNNFLTASATPIESVKYANTNIIPLTITNDVTLEPGEVEDISIKLYGPISESAVFVEGHNLPGIRINFEISNSWSTVKIQNISMDDNVTFAKNSKVGAIVPNPSSILFPKSISFLEHEKIFSIHKPIFGLKPESDLYELPLPTLSNEHCFDLATPGHRSLEKVQLKPLPEADYMIVFIAIKVLELDGVASAKEILLSDAENKIELRELFHPEATNPSTAFDGIVKLAQKSFLLEAGEVSSLIPVATYEQFLTSVSQSFHGKKIILVGYNVLRMAEVLLDMSIKASVKVFNGVYGLCDLDWVPPFEEQSMAAKSFQEFLPDQLAAEFVEKVSSVATSFLSSLIDAKKKCVKHFCTDFGYVNFISKFCLDTKTCLDLILAKQTRKKIIFKKLTNQQKQQLQHEHQQQQHDQQQKDAVQSLSQEKINALKTLAQMFMRNSQESPNETIGADAPMTPLESTIQVFQIDPAIAAAVDQKCEDVEMFEQQTNVAKDPPMLADKNEVATPETPNKDIEKTNLVPTVDNLITEQLSSQIIENFDPTVQSFDQNASNFDQTVESLELNAGNFGKPVESLELNADNFDPTTESQDPTANMLNSVDDSECTSNTTRTRENETRGKSVTKRGHVDPMKENLGETTSPEQTSDDGSESQEETRRARGHSNETSNRAKRQCLPVLCSLTWIKLSSGEFLTAVDLTVPYCNLDYTADSVLPPMDWNDQLKQQFYDLKSGFWIPKDCTSAKPIIKTEDVVVKELRKKFEDIKKKFPSVPLILVTVLPNHIHYLEKVFCRFKATQFQSFFAGWCDLTDLVYSSTSSDCHVILKSAEETSDKILELFCHTVGKDKLKNYRKSHMMQKILKALATGNPIDAFVCSNFSQFALPKTEKFLQVFCDVQTIKINGDATSFWKTAGFFTPHNKCGWMTPIIPHKAHEANYIKHEEFSKNDSTWIYKAKDKKGEEVVCRDKSYAVTKMADLISKECENNGCSGIVLTSLSMTTGKRSDFLDEI